MPINPQNTRHADGLPAGFRLRPDGVEHEVNERDEGGNPVKQWVHLCSPLRVTSLARDGHGEAWGRVIEVTDPDNVVHRWTLPAELLATNPVEVVGRLVGLGLRLPLQPSTRATLVSLLNRWSPTCRVRSTPHLGWADDTCSTFVLGDGSSIGSEQVVLQSRTPAGPAAQMRPGGTLEGWRDGVATLAIGNPVLLASISVALAGPLLLPLGQDGGGVHLRGESSRGKTTALAAAGSVWGSPAFKATWRATSNGLESIAAACNSTALLLDEMSEVDGRAAGEVAYMVSNGTGKARAARDGSSRSAARWRLAFISTGEIGLADKMAEANRRPMAGQAVRLLDLHVTDRRYGVFDYLHCQPTGDAFARRLAEAAASDYGHAGPALVRWLLEDKATRLAAAAAHLEAFRHAASDRVSDAGPQVQRVINRLAVFAAAGELASDAGITGWAAGAATAAMLDMLQVWIHGRGGKGDAEAVDALQRVQHFLLKHGDSRFEDLTVFGDDRRTVPNRAGWRDSQCFHLHAEAMAEVFQGGNLRAGLKALLAAGWLQPGDSSHLAARLSTVPGRPRVYRIVRSALGLDDSELVERPAAQQESSSALF